MRLLDQQPHEKVLPPLPKGEDITNLHRTDLGSLEGDKIQETLEWISFETLQREIQERTKRGEKLEVIDSLEKNLTNFTLDPIRNRIFEQLGLLHYQMGSQDPTLDHYRLASEYMEKALDLNPHSFKLLTSLAGLYLYLNDVEKALATLRRADPKLIPENDNTSLFALHFNYACAYAMFGEKEKALTSLELAANVDPASTFSSLGDPQLDGIRGEASFKRINIALRQFVLREGETKSPGPSPARP
jgi:tetratricopeptide (TPR) repeat protein